MRSVYIIRHAKSSWGDFTVSDFDRTLNDRGSTDAPIMAKRLLEKNIKIDAFLSSPAKRARKTAKLFCHEYHVNSDKIILVDSLYEASANTFYKLINALPDNFKHVVIFSHNPGITEFVNTLCKQVQVNNMPTCAIFAVQADIKEWTEFADAEKNFLFFDYPKA